MDVGFGDALAVLFIVGWVYLWTRIFGKAGYSPWLGVIGVIPIAPAVVLAVATWPVERQLSCTRAATSGRMEGDAYALLDEATRLERRKQFEAALDICAQIVAQWPDTPAATDARIVADGIREKLARERTE